MAAPVAVLVLLRAIFAFRAALALLTQRPERLAIRPRQIPRERVPFAAVVLAALRKTLGKIRAIARVRIPTAIGRFAGVALLDAASALFAAPALPMARRAVEPRPRPPGTAFALIGARILNSGSISDAPRPRV